MQACHDPLEVIPIIKKFSDIASLEGISLFARTKNKFKTAQIISAVSFLIASSQVCIGILSCFYLEVLPEDLLGFLLSSTFTKFTFSHVINPS